MATRIKASLKSALGPANQLSPASILYRYHTNQSSKLLMVWSRFVELSDCLYVWIGGEARELFPISQLRPVKKSKEAEIWRNVK